MVSIVKRGRKVKSRSLAEIIEKGLKEKIDIFRSNGRLYAGEAGICATRTSLYSLGAHVLGDIIGPTFHDHIALLYMETGNTLHELVCKAFEKEGILLFKEFTLPSIVDPEFGDLNLGGRIDAIVFHENKIRIVEIKSCGNLKPKIEDHHRKQALIYSALTGLSAKVLYVSRKVQDNTNIMTRELLSSEYELLYTEEEKFEAIRTLTYTTLCIREKVVPPIPFVDKKPCKDCFFENFCWGHNEAFDAVTAKYSFKSEQQQAIIESNATKWARNIIAAEKARRNGILKHIRETKLAKGETKAAEFLDGDWDSKV